MDSKTINRLRDNFSSRNIQTEFFKSLAEVKDYILNSIPPNCAVGIGHSVTLQAMDITNALVSRGNIVFDKELASTKEECNDIKRKALLTDFYISGSNAISEDGRIVNVDHSGNRVAALTFGPEKVFIVVGTNKIAANLDEAIKRVKNIACPLNAKRAGFNPPCVTLNKCVDCLSKERVCNTLSIIEGQSNPSRIKLLIIDDNFGF
ncbi:lactate utilization protein [Clostridium sp. C8-1-8]|uniref:lactate utilization protein n=1 Tax=Clostridium sp. C8-1-8 TaxID=2698831 RepID=UPI001371A9E6|nr:lactate utilization protein [Clostridium sp. C8-1-8]